MRSKIPLLIKHLWYSKEDLLQDILTTDLWQYDRKGDYQRTTINIQDNLHSLNFKNFLECYGLIDQLDTVVSTHLDYFQRQLESKLKHRRYAEALYLIENYNLEQYPWVTKIQETCEHMNTEDVERYHNTTPRRFDWDTGKMGKVDWEPDYEIRRWFVDKIIEMTEQEEVIEFTPQDQELIKYYKLERTVRYYQSIVTDWQNPFKDSKASEIADIVL